MEIIATCRRLARHPLMGTKRQDVTPLPVRSGASPGISQLRDPEAIPLQVVAVLRGKRDLKSVLAQLRQIQAERRQHEQEALLQADDLLEMHTENKELPYNPARDGFVFPVTTSRLLSSAAIASPKPLVPPSSASRPVLDRANRPSV